MFFRLFKSERRTNCRPASRLACNENLSVWRVIANAGRGIRCRGRFETRPYAVTVRMVVSLRGRADTGAQDARPTYSTRHTMPTPVGAGFKPAPTDGYPAPPEKTAPLRKQKDGSPSARTGLPPRFAPRLRRGFVGLARDCGRGPWYPL
jgi:hypothetical protein